MKNIICLIAGAILLGSCGTNEPVPTTISNKILLLGASRVQGNPPNYHSYRYPLWIELQAEGFEVDFVGNEKDNYVYSSAMDDFDRDHEGHSGWTSGQILEEVHGWLMTIDTPDVVLFSSPGGNDALDGLPYNEALTNVSSIIDTLQAYNPNVTILLELMAPGHSFIMLGDLLTYFEALKVDIPNLATSKSTLNSSVIVVDMATGFSDSLLADPVHYNLDGAEFIASRYTDALKNVLVK